jgi:hypothetical protein
MCHDRNVNPTIRPSAHVLLPGCIRGCKKGPELNSSLILIDLLLRPSERFTGWADKW